MLIAVLLEAMGAVTVEDVLLLTVGTTVFVVLLLVEVAVGAAVAQAARAITLIAITRLKIILRFIDFLHL
jgi:hypothetical protein